MNTGKVIFFKGKYGYISCPDYQYNLFFHKNDVSGDYAKFIKRGDEVQFNSVNNPKRPGRQKATQIIFLKFQVPSFEKMRIKYDRNDLFVGFLKNWNGRSGYIKSSLLLTKDTFLYYTRLLSESVKPKEILLFQPVESVDPRSHYFAYFAYSLKDAKIDDLWAVINNYGTSAHAIMESQLSEKLNWLLKLKLESDGQAFFQMKQIAKKYIDKYGEIDNKVIQILSEDSQVFLWEEGLTSNIDFNILLKLFCLSPQKERDRILLIITNIYIKESLLKEYVNWLISTRQYFKINQELKPALRFLKTDSDAVRLGLYNFLYNFLIDNLPADKLIDLWLFGYLEKLPTVDLLINNFNFNDLDYFNILLNRCLGDNDVENDSFQKKTSRALIDFVIRNFKDGFFDSFHLVGVLLFNFLQKKERNVYIKYVQPELESFLTISELYILKSYQVLINESTEELIKQLPRDFNIVYIINESILNGSSLLEKTLNDFLRSESLYDRLCLDLPSFPWNILSEPANFLNVVLRNWRYHRLFFSNKNVESELAVFLFHQLDKYSVHHLRLYLTFQKDLSGELDFYGFMKPFKELMRSEKKEIKAALERYLEKNFEDEERAIVEPCINFERSDRSTIYNATIKNIYFEDGALELRMEDGSYTYQYDNDIFVTKGINRISPNSALSNLEILVEVQNRIVIHIEGLDRLLAAIYQKEIKAILSKIKLDGNYQSSTESYSSDRDLKKKIIDYLKSNQLENTNPLEIFEYTTNYVRYRDSTPRKKNRYNLANLYSIKVDEDKIAIIWESLEFDQDRSTFIFISPLDRHQEQMKRIMDAVSSYKYLRSYLNSRLNNIDVREKDKKNEIQNNLKKFLGYVGNIRKRRGLKDSFERWLRNLNKIIRIIPLDIIDDFNPNDVVWDEYELTIRKYFPDEKRHKKEQVKKAIITNELEGEIDIAIASEHSSDHELDRIINIISELDVFFQNLTFNHE